MRAHRLPLLRLVHAKADVSPLLEEGLTYSQITQMLRELLGDGLIELVGSTPVLTQAGLAAIRTEGGTSKPRGDGGFIGPRLDAKIDKLEATAIYLPPKSNSYF